MISAVSKNGAAISAKRIINTAPMAKFGRDEAVALGEDARGLVVVVVAEAGRADDGVDAVLREVAQVFAGRIDVREVDRDLGLGRSNASADELTWMSSDSILATWPMSSPA